MAYSHTITDNGVLRIFIDNRLVSEISDCAFMTSDRIENLVMEVLNDLGYDFLISEEHIKEEK